jgi:hypothetical protein
MDMSNTKNIYEEQQNSSTFISECPATCSSNAENTLESFFVRSYKASGLNF